MTVQRTFPPAKGSVPEARRFVSQALGEVSAEVRDTVLVMVSELATNAVLHASTGFEVSVDRSPHEVTVSVADRGTGTPAVQSPDSREPHGRGLRIVQSFADDWGVVSSSDAGKAVWFRLSTGGTAPVPAEDRERAVRPSGQPEPVGVVPLGSDTAVDVTPPGGGSSHRPSARLRSSRARSRRSPGCRPAGRSLIHRV